MPELLERRVRYLRELREHVHLPRLHRLLGLLDLRDLFRLDGRAVGLMRCGSRLDLPSCPGAHCIGVRVHPRESRSILLRPWGSRQLLDPGVHRGLDHLHDLQNPMLVPVARYENLPNGIGGLCGLRKIDWLGDTGPSLPLDDPWRHISLPPRWFALVNTLAG